MAAFAGDLTAIRRTLEQAFVDFKAGRTGVAAQAYREVLNQIPDQPDALHMLGVIAQQMGRTELALQLFDETLRTAPRFAQAWSNRALILRVLKRHDEALQSAREAIACDPKHADGWDMAGLLLRENREYKAACEHHARAAALAPNNPLIQNNYAIALAAIGRVKDAFRAATKAIALNPSFAIAHLTRGNILNEAGWAERAVAEFRKAREILPSLTETIGSEGRAQMLIGEMAQGWEGMEARNIEDARCAGLPRWQGEKTGRLLLIAEQGIGDFIHFLRFAPVARGRADSLTLQVPASMKRLTTAQKLDAVILTKDDPLPTIDAFAPLMSMPCILKTTLNDTPAPIPYITAQEEWRAPRRKQIASLPSPRIGIVWMGNPLYKNDHNRSVPRDEITPLLDVAAAHFVSLQKGSTTATASKLGIFDAEAELSDFADSAGLIAELDLVISVDTAVAHLAGAMGKPVWTLLPFTPDWRWMLGREDSPWYPSMRLFRQTSPQDWPGVIVRVIVELKKFLAGDMAVLKPTPWDGKVLRRNPDALDLPEE